jgi:hypothetical protein
MSETAAHDQWTWAKVPAASFQSKTGVPNCRVRSSQTASAATIRRAAIHFHLVR